MTDSPPSADTSPTFWRIRPGIALGMLLVIVLFYMAREHYGHVLGLLPYMILLLCPLMHVFGHHHGGHNHHGDTSTSIKDANRR